MAKKKKLKLTQEQQTDLLEHLAEDQLMTEAEVDVRVSLLQHSGCADSMVVGHLNHLLTSRDLKKPSHKVRQRLSHHISALSSPKPWRQDK
jgi:hypothetical protein